MVRLPGEADPLLPRLHEQLVLAWLSLVGVAVVVTCLTWHLSLLDNS